MSLGELWIPPKQRGEECFLGSIPKAPCEAALRRRPTGGVLNFFRQRQIHSKLSRMTMPESPALIKLLKQHGAADEQPPKPVPSPVGDGSHGRRGRLCDPLAENERARQVMGGPKTIVKGRDRVRRDRVYLRFHFQQSRFEEG